MKIFHPNPPQKYPVNSRLLVVDDDSSISIFPHHPMNRTELYSWNWNSQGHNDTSMIILYSLNDHSTTIIQCPLGFSPLNHQYKRLLVDDDSSISTFPLVNLLIYWSSHLSIAPVSRRRRLRGISKRPASLKSRKKHVNRVPSWAVKITGKPCENHRKR